MLVYQVGLALKAELETTAEKLYAESMANALAVHLLLRYTHPYLAITSLNGLSKHNLALADIAHQVGFASQSHFNRYFKRFVGVTPTAFRQQ